MRQEAVAHYDVRDETGEIAPIRMDPEEMSLKIKALPCIWGLWNHDNTLFHNVMREASERIPKLGKLLIDLDNFFYKNNMSGNSLVS